MSTATTDKYCDAGYQRAVGELVQREVVYCVSHLIHELTQKLPDLIEEHPGLYYRAPTQQDCEDEGNVFEEREDGYYWYEASDPSEVFGPESTQEEAVEDCIQYHGIDGGEVYEHWIVTRWLADRLEDAGEAIEHDVYGLKVWGRRTTGQAIALDHVMCEIYDALHAS